MTGAKTGKTTHQPEPLSIQEPAEQADEGARPLAKDSPAGIFGPSPDPATNLAIADIALRGGAMLARHAVERALLGRAYSPSKARQILKGRSMSEAFLHRTIAKVAMRSIPGAIVVGGGLIAKTLYDRHKARRATQGGTDGIEQMAQSGSEGTGTD